MSWFDGKSNYYGVDVIYSNSIVTKRKIITILFMALLNIKREKIKKEEEKMIFSLFFKMAIKVYIYIYI
jgi:hypothetical protein